MAEAVNLDALTAKQLAKEYKLTIKEVKSKDLSVREAALKKFDDVRYLLDGGCIVPFIETIVGKKKTIDYTKIALQCLLNYLEKRDNVPLPSIPALNTILTLSGHLNVLEHVASLAFYKEEVKKVKGKVVVVKESEMESSLRHLALKVLINIVTDISSAGESALELSRKFATIPNIQSHLCAYLNNIPKRLEDEALHAATLQEGVWALRVLIAVLRFEVGGINKLLVENATTMTVLYDNLLQQEEFKLYCIEIYSIIVDDTKGLEYFTGDEKYFNSLVGIFDKTAEEIAGPVGSNTDYSNINAVGAAGGAPAAGAAGGKGGGKDKKDDKKDAKGGKDAGKDAAAAAAAAQAEQGAGAALSIEIAPQRLKVCILKAILNTFIAVTTSCSTFIVVETASKLASICANVSLSSVVWTTLAEITKPEPAELKASEVVDACCNLLGLFGRTADPAVRVAVCETGALNCLVTVLNKSKQVLCLPASVPGEDNSEEGEMASAEQKAKKQQLLTLRRYAEQAMLSLATVPISEEQAVEAAEANSNINVLPVEAGGAFLRWNSCSGFAVDLNLFPEAVEGVGPITPAAFPVVLLLEIVASANDVDLANRGIRILSAIIHCSSSLCDIQEFCKRIFLPHVQVMQKVSALAQARAEMLIADVDKKLAAKAARVEAEAAVEAPVNEGEGELAAAAAPEVGDIDPATISMESLSAPGTAANTMLVTPLVYETLYHTLCVAHVLLQASSDNVNVFGTDERVKLLSQIIYMCGPVGTKEDAMLEECTITITDARLVRWPATGVVDALLEPLSSVNAAAHKADATESRLLRPLVFDVLTDVAASDAKYRTFTADVPPAMGQPQPESTCPCVEAASRVSKYCTDACVSTVLVTGRFAIANNCVISTPYDSFAFNLEHKVLHASIRTVNAIATTGVNGIVTALENLAAKGIDAQTSIGAIADSSALSHLEAFIKENVSADCATTDGTWKRPDFHDTYLASLTNLDGLPNDVENVPQAVEFWPFITLCGSLLGVLQNPYMPDYIVKTAVTAIKSFCHLQSFERYIQPVVVDVLAGVLLSMGGGIFLPSCLGRFGTTGGVSAPFEEGISFLTYLYGRGECREAAWEKYAEEQAAAAAAAAAAVDPNAKPGKKEEKKKDDKGKNAPAVVPGVALYHVPEEGGAFIDPNHGPGRKYWLKLITLVHNDTLLLAENSCPLVSCIQSDLSALAIQLVQLRVDVNVKVDHCTPLMYALVLQEEALVQELISNSNADINAIDDSSNPCIKFSCLSLSSDCINEQLKESYRNAENRCNAGDRPLIEVLGGSHLLKHLAAGGVDVNVSDAAFGNFPLHYCSGLGQACIQIGGYTLHITNSAYVPTVAGSDSACRDAIRLLHAHGANLNNCNLKGQTVLHVASAHCDVEIMRFLIKNNAKTNTLDSCGLYPMHYVAIGSENADAPKAFDLLVEYAVGRSAETKVFADDRTGKSIAEKYEMDIDAALNDVFADIMNPNAIQATRLQHSDVLLALNKDNMSVFQLAMAAQELPDEPYLEFSRYGTKEIRMELALHIYKVALKHNFHEQLLSNVDNFGMNSLHAACLLFVGITPRIPLQPKDHTKRNKKYASAELHLLDVLFGMCRSELLDIHAPCVRELKKHFGDDPNHNYEIPPSWTVLHGCIMNDNYEMLEQILSFGVGTIESYPYIYFAAQFNHISPRTAKLLVAAVNEASNTQQNPLFNRRVEGVTRPIFAAIRSHNLALLEELVQYNKCDLNLSDMFSGGRNAVHEVVHYSFHPNSYTGGGDDYAIGMQMLSLFEKYASDRVDLLVPDNDGRTCIDEVLEHRNIEMLQVLIGMRKNDVAGHLLTVREVHAELNHVYVIAGDAPAADPAAGAVASESAPNVAADTGDPTAAAAVADAAAPVAPTDVAVSAPADAAVVAGEADAAPVAPDAPVPAPVTHQSILMAIEREYVDKAVAHGFIDYEEDLSAEAEDIFGSDAESSDEEVVKREEVEEVIEARLAGGNEGEDVEDVPAPEKLDENGNPIVQKKFKKRKVYKRGTSSPELEEKEEFLRVILYMLSTVGNNVVGPEAHVHPCFHKGMMFSEHCEEICRLLDARYNC